MLLSKKFWDLLVQWRRVWPRLFPQKKPGKRGEGYQVSEVSRRSAPSKIKAAILTLEKQNISFRGPIETPGGNRIVLIGQCILTEAEVVRLHESGKLDSENIDRLLTDLRRDHTVAHKERELVNNANPQNRRRSRRVSLQVAVLVRAEAPGGEHTKVQAFTSEVSAHGGSLESPLKLTANQKITLVNPHTGSEIGCRVVRIDASTESCFTIAFEFSQRSPQFWPISFVPKDWGAMEKIGNEIH